MKNFRSAILAIAFMASVFSLGAKEKEDVTLVPELAGSYTMVHVNGDFRVKYCPEGEPVKIVAKENITDLLECKVVNDTLRINYVSGKGAKAIMSAKTPVILLPHNAEVTKILLGGTVHMESEAEIKAENLEFKLSGASRLIAPVDIGNLKVHCAGTSNVTLTGKAENFKIQIDGASRVAACEGFECKVADLNINGTGVVRINCTDTLMGETAGVSVVKYLTEPKEMKVKSNGINGVSKIK